MLKWEKLATDYSCPVYRAKVPGGWLVSISGYEGEGLTFYPDPSHEWDGSSLS